MLLTSGLPLVTLLAAPAQADRPVGTEILDAVVVDVTDEGFDVVADVVPALIPPEFAIPEVHASECEEQCIFGECWCWYEYDLDVTNGMVFLSPGPVDFTPGAGVLNLSVTVNVAVNSPADPLYLYMNGGVVGITVNDDCDLWVDSVPITLTGTVELAIVNGALDATVILNPVDTSQLGPEDIEVSGCVISDIEDIVGFFGGSLWDLVLPTVETEVDAAVADLGPEIEALLEDSFASASISETLDLNGVPLTLYLEPRDVQIVNEGLRLSLAGAFDTVKDDCISAYGIDGSLETPSAPPNVGEVPTNLGFDTHLGIYADDDFVNNALFALWYGGLLCYALDDDSSLDLPLPINTALLGLLAPGFYTDLFPEVAPMSIMTRPRQPPRAEMVGANDVNILVDELGIELAADLDGRRVRLVNLDLAVDAGADLSFDGATGLLGVGVVLDASRIDALVTYNELVPDANATMEGAFVALFDQLAGPLLGDALSGLSFALPAFEGLGLTNLVAEPAGTSDDRLGVYASIGEAAYYDPNAPAGCGCGTTGTSEGCDTGCTTGALPASGVPMVFPLLLAALRRRRRD